MSRLRSFSALIGGALVLAAVANAPAGARAVRPAANRIVVQRGQPVQIAVALDDTGFGASFGASARQAVQMAVERHPRIDGFPVQLTAFSGLCENGSPASLAENAATASAIAGDARNAAVIGHPCSAEASAWLPVYESAGLVTINGSTTGPGIPAFGPTVFNGTGVPGPGFDAWYATVVALPGDVAWRARFQTRFGSPPSDFADLYFDAANVLLAALRETAGVDHGRLVIDRGALAARVRRTRRFPGVTCTVTLDSATGYRLDDPASLAACARRGGDDGSGG